MVRRRIDLRLLLAATFGMAAALAAAAAASQSQDMWLEAGIEPAQVYVQAQAIYRLRFYQAVDVRDLKINGPSTRLADLRPIGTGRVYETQRDGRRYRVHERSYAILPFSSGPLELAGAYATGRVAAIGATSADGRHTVRLEATAQTLKVLPVPAAAGEAAWLPAYSLTLTESWSAPVTEVRLGQAQRRSIRVEASGIDAGQIPPLQVTTSGMLVEAEPPRLENRVRGERHIGVREQTFRMVALRAGDLFVPELQLRWWNLDTDVPELASLPARTLRVSAAELVTASDLPMAPELSPPQAKATYAPKLSQALLAGGALLGAVVALAYVSRPGERAARRLQRACRRGTAASVRDGLLRWAEEVWEKEPPLTLNALAERLSDPVATQALGTIERLLYGQSCGPFHAVDLGAAVLTIKSRNRQWRRKLNKHSCLSLVKQRVTR